MIGIKDLKITYLHPIILFLANNKYRPKLSKIRLINEIARKIRLNIPEIIDVIILIIKKMTVKRDLSISSPTSNNHCDNY